MKRKVLVTLSSTELTVEELSQIRETLETIEDWQLMGEGHDTVSNFKLEVTSICP